MSFRGSAEDDTHINWRRGEAEDDGKGKHSYNELVTICTKAVISYGVCFIPDLLLALQSGAQREVVLQDEIGCELQTRNRVYFLISKKPMHEVRSSHEICSTSSRGCSKGHGSILISQHVFYSTCNTEQLSYIYEAAASPCSQAFI